MVVVAVDLTAPVVEEVVEDTVGNDAILEDMAVAVEITETEEGEWTEEEEDIDGRGQDHDLVLEKEDGIHQQVDIADMAVITPQHQFMGNQHPVRMEQLLIRRIHHHRHLTIVVLHHTIHTHHPLQQLLQRQQRLQRIRHILQLPTDTIMERTRHIHIARRRLKMDLRLLLRRNNLLKARMVQQHRISSHRLNHRSSPSNPNMVLRQHKHNNHMRMHNLLTSNSSQPNNNNLHHNKLQRNRMEHLKVIRNKLRANNQLLNRMVLHHLLPIHIIKELKAMHIQQTITNNQLLQRPKHPNNIRVILLKEITSIRRVADNQGVVDIVCAIKCIHSVLIQINSYRIILNLCHFGRLSFHFCVQW